MDMPQVTQTLIATQLISSQCVDSIIEFPFKVVFSVVDCLLRFFGIKQLTGSASKHILYLVSVFGYACLLKAHEQSFRDDIVVGVLLLASSSSTLTFVWKKYEAHVTHTIFKFCGQIKIYGSLRVFVFMVSVILTALLVVKFADVSMTTVSRIVSEKIIGRLDDNIIDLENDREAFGEVIIHPITKGEINPQFLTKLYRYPREDVQMTCTFKMLWFSGAFPVKDQIVWRRNGKRLSLTDRHKHELSVREDKKNNTEAFYKKYGLSEYEVNSTLTIHLLRESEFGNYTCYGSQYMNIPVRDYITKTMRSEVLNTTANPTETPMKQSTKRRRARSSKEQNKVVRRRLFQDKFTLIKEFSLVQMSRREQVVRAPASSILQFRTSYWHLSNREDIEIDYSINRQSYYNVCPDGLFHGCSKFLLLYWYFGHEVGGRFGIPPLQLFTIWKDPDYPVERFSLIHCLCENAYGYHSVKYLRRYYNSTSKRHELIEILHPHALYVVPREQKMLHLFVNRSQCSPIIEQPVSQKPPSVCKPGWDFETIKEFAMAAVYYFHWIEVFVITTVFVFSCIAFRLHNLILAILGRYFRRLILEGSMGFLSTAEISRTLPLGKKACPEEQAEEDVYYDVYLSYSEAETDMAKVHNEILPYLETRGLKVCVRERDIPVNLPEIQAISKAMKNSTKFVIFLSKAYFEDNFRKDFEAAMIFETACDRTDGSDAILVVKLDPCEMPTWLNHLKVNDWTAFCLSLQDHLLRLLKWLEPRERRSTVRSKIDACLMVLPLFGVMFVNVLVFLAAPE